MIVILALVLYFSCTGAAFIYMHSKLGPDCEPFESKHDYWFALTAASFCWPIFIRGWYLTAKELHKK